MLHDRKRFRRSLRIPIIRTRYSPKHIDTYKSKTKASLTKAFFIKYFAKEVATRYQIYLIKKPSTKPVEERYKRLFNRVGTTLWDTAINANIPAVNLAFIFLNRYYAVGSGKIQSITRMSYCLEEFLIEISHERSLLTLLNYDENQRKLICTFIRELQACKKSRKLKTFMNEYINGYRIVYPQHMQERSRMFETMLVMLDQLQSRKMTYFFENHALEILKAHLWGLRKFGDPIRLHLGHFKDDNALHRLKTYYSWIRRRDIIGEQSYSFGTQKASSNLKGYDF